MMTSNLDFYRAANLLIRQHGNDAQAEAERRAAEMQRRGSKDGAAVWRRVAAAVAQLQADGGTVH